MSSDYCCGYPKTWKLEGRNSENENWKLIDERIGETDLDGNKYVKAFLSNKLPSCTFRIFRLNLTEDKTGAPNYLALNEMDFIGKTSLVPNPKSTSLCQTRVCSCRNTPIMMSFLIALFITGNIIRDESFIDTQQKKE